ncbi:DoxX family protein [Variovorax sp. LT1R20]|uniref:DoxX family protein n=1 Tax=Variovorax sp. LT1R20 TaxID=3443729 RepID=UPI003F48B31E
MTSSSSLSPLQRRIVWGVRIVLALAFGAAGAAKLAGVPQMVQVFDAIGFGQWFRYVTGVVEVGGALLMLLPATGFFGALLLAVTMACGAATHLVLIGGNAVPAVVLMLLSAFVAWRLRPVPRLAAITA